jgi:hypothetical protein
MFGYITRLSQRRGVGNLLLQIISSCRHRLRGGGGVIALWFKPFRLTKALVSLQNRKIQIQISNVYLKRFSYTECPGSVKFWDGSGRGSGSGFCSFRQWPSRCQQKIVFFFLVKDKKSLRSHKIVEIKVFLNFLLVDGRIWNRTCKLRIRMRIQEVQKPTVQNRTDPDADPEHCIYRTVPMLLNE